MTAVSIVVAMGAGLLAMAYVHYLVLHSQSRIFFDDAGAPRRDAALKWWIPGLLAGSTVFLALT